MTSGEALLTCLRHRVDVCAHAGLVFIPFAPAAARFALCALTPLLIYVCHMHTDDQSKTFMLTPFRQAWV
jgi:hypothetical protein